jgi:hypothetical protein
MMMMIVIITTMLPTLICIQSPAQARGVLCTGHFC